MNKAKPTATTTALRDQANVHAVRPHLSPRLAQVVELAATGMTDKQIADEMRISEQTVGSYLKDIYRRYGVHSRAALVARFLQTGHSET